MSIIYINPYAFPAANWTPANITTALWLDADDSATVTVVSGDVSQWDDKSGNGRNATQVTAGKRPFLNSSGVNGKNSILFDNVSAGEALITTYDQSQSNNYMICFAGNQASTGATRMVASSSKNALISISRSGNCVFVGGNVRDIGWASINTTNIGILLAPSSGNFQFYGNGTDITDANKAVESFGTINFGAHGGLNGSEPANGNICEVVVVLESSTSTREKIEGYLAHKWGLTANLPGGHPYKTTAPTV
jgi:hypothetical protein